MTSWNTRANKYHAKKVTFDGVEFDSRKEARRFAELKLLEKAGEITQLKRQVTFELIPTQREPDTIGKRGGIKRGRVIERACTYTADFTYKIVLPFATPDEFPLVVEDVKSPATRTEQYKIKRKLMLYIHGVEIKEV